MLQHVGSRLRRHPRHVALAALCVGLMLSDESAFAVGALAVAIVLVSCTESARLALIAAALIIGGGWIGAARLAHIDHAAVKPWIGRSVTVRGIVIKRERPTPHAYRFRLRLTRLAAAGGAEQALDDTVQAKVRRPRRLPELAIGQVVRIRGDLVPLPQRRTGEFDYAGYLRRAGVHAVLWAGTIAAEGDRRGPVGVLDGFRRRAEAGVAAGLEPRVAALAQGIVLGQDERIPQPMVEDFKASGLAHLLAVSGQNVTLLAVLALPLLGAAGLGRRGRLIGVIALIVVYVPLTGAGPSIMRAGAMGVAAAVAQLSGRPASRWYALLLACLFTLLIDPRAWLDSGWQLSFAAVAGIFLVGGRLARAFARLPQPLAEGAAMTVAATAATAPLLAFQFGRVSLVSLLANLIVLPVIGPIMWTGMLAAAVAPVSLQAAALLNAIDGFCLAYLAAIARWSAHLPGAVLPLSLDSPLALAASYVVPIALMLGWGRLRRGQGRGGGQNQDQSALRRAVSIGALLALLIGGAAVALTREDSNRVDVFTVTFLDVGQGDSILLQTPEGGAALVDGGPPQSGVVHRLRAAGVRSLDLVVLTHAQADHEGGLEQVFRELPVRLLLDGGGHDPLHRRIVALARQHGSRVVAAQAGMVLRLGGLRFRVLWPERDAPAFGDPNRRAVVAIASHGRWDVFLPADAESDVTGALRLPEVDVLKVAHHGSADPGLAPLLARLQPEIAVIDVGAGNRFGHPDPGTLARLRAAIPTLLRTDLDGNVRLSLGSREARVTTDR
jgi:competence protein ComEC